MTAEAEIIALTFAAFKKLNLEIAVKINSRKLLNDILTYCGIDEFRQETAILSIDKLEKFGLTVVKNELNEKGIDESKIEKIMNWFQDKFNFSK